MAETFQDRAIEAGNACHCCGWMFQIPGQHPRFSGGRIHLDCWIEHHSDPTCDWPPEHVCAGDPS